MKKSNFKEIEKSVKIVESKIISQKDYYDMYGFQKQLGVLK
jgi:hypothetical protein